MNYLILIIELKMSNEFIRDPLSKRVADWNNDNLIKIRRTERLDRLLLEKSKERTEEKNEKKLPKGTIFEDVVANTINSEMENEMKRLNQRIDELSRKNNELIQKISDELQLEILKYLPKINKICNLNNFEKVNISKESKEDYKILIEITNSSKSHLFSISKISDVETMTEKLDSILKCQKITIKHEL
jgi:hypothetical protein